jgi:hypothetical protein
LVRQIADDTKLLVGGHCSPYSLLYLLSEVRAVKPEKLKESFKMISKAHFHSSFESENHALLFNDAKISLSDLPQNTKISKS